MAEYEICTSARCNHPSPSRKYSRCCRKGLCKLMGCSLLCWQQIRCCRLLMCFPWQQHRCVRSRNSTLFYRLLPSCKRHLSLVGSNPPAKVSLLWDWWSALNLHSLRYCTKRALLSLLLLDLRKSEKLNL